MSELEKKFSDFQETECKDFELDPQEQGADKVCPTCIPNPNFVLEAPWWEIKESYLNEAECEYHVRISAYEILEFDDKRTIMEAGDSSISSLYRKMLPDKDLLQQKLIYFGVEKILTDQKKPYNEKILTDLVDVGFIKDGPYDNYNTLRFGSSYLIAVPAFNFDQIDDEDVEDEEEISSINTDLEVIVDGAILNRQLLQLRFSLELYEKYYSLATQQIGEGFVIRQENNRAIRISYNNARDKLRRFKNLINDALARKNYVPLGSILGGGFSRKQPGKIKIVFKDNGKDYDLDDIYVRAEGGCNFYQPLGIKESSELKNPSMRIVYHFMSRIDQMISEMTSKDSKPWAEWTVDHWYPNMILDNEAGLDTEETENGLECLLEQQLGLGAGLTDTLAKEIMSAFKGIEQEAQKQVCRDLTKKAEGSSTSLAEGKGGSDPSPSEQRAALMKKRYTDEFKNQFLKHVKSQVEELNKQFEPTDAEPTLKASKLKIDNVFEETKKAGINISPFTPDPYKLEGTDVPQSQHIIDSAQTLNDKAADWANTKFYNLDNGNFGNQIQNSPHWAEAQDAWTEVTTFPDNSVTSMFKKRDFSDAMRAMTLCNTAELGKKAAKCLLAGVSMDDFLDAIIDKMFEFMKINTLDLFLNNLPASLRQDLDEAIAQEFGGDVNIATLISLKKVSQGEAKLSDITKTKKIAKELLKISEKFINGNALTEEEEKFVNDNFVNGNETIKDLISLAQAYKGAEKSKEKRKALNSIKDVIRKNKQDNQAEAWTRIKNALGFDTSSQAAQDSTLSDTATPPEDLPVTQSSSQEQLVNLPETHTVKSGETLWKIAVTELGDGSRYMEIANLNNLPNPDLISVGQVLNLPPKPVDVDQALNDALTQGGTGTFRDASPEESAQIEAANATLNDGGTPGQVEQSPSTTPAPTPSADTSTERDPTEPSEFELAAASFEETALGVKVDVVFDVMFDFLIDYIIDSIGVDELLEDLRKYPVLDFVGDLVVTSFTCPNAPVIFPPPGDFMKSLSIDVCDPTFDIMIPKIVWPNIDVLAAFKAEIPEIIREKVIELCTDLFIRMVQRFVNTLESSLCSFMGVPANTAANALKDKSLTGNFIDALNESFCNDATNPETGKSKAEELAEALFSPLLLQSNQNYEGSSKRVTNMLSSVAGTNDFLNAMVARPGEEDEQFGKMVANASNVLTPEMDALLGSPDQVAYFFRTLGSFLSPEDRERIRDLLDSGVPNLPISKAICMNNEQLQEWNDLRQELLANFPNPEDIVPDLNNRTRTAAEEILDLVAGTDDMFTDALRDELDKDACNPNNVFNQAYQSELEKELESAEIDSEYENLTRVMSYSFMRKNGILGHALSDNEGRAEFARRFIKFFAPGYANTQDEWQAKFDSKEKFGQWFMKNYNDGKARGIYPDTIAIKSRDDLLGGMIDYDFQTVKTSKFSSRNVVMKYKDDDGDFSYKLHVAASNLRQPKKVFGYNLQILENIDDSGFTRELNFNTPIAITQKEDEYLQSKGFIYKSNNEDDIRKSAFNKIMGSKLPINRKYSQLYEETYKMCTDSLVKDLLTDPTQEGGIPNGFRFGYKSNNLSKESFKYYNPNTETPYDKDEEEKILGDFADSRITALDPAKYGGRYSNPHYYIEPRQHFGWSELAMKSFRSQDGCDPKTPPLLDMSDIKQREKQLSNSLKNDPRLSRDQECINDIPFKLLTNAKMQAKMDGAVRTTIRTYLAEYFMKGYGLFSNLQVRFDNFDQSLPLYIANKMKKEMSELGRFTANRKVRIVRERYWYTFLEQSVEAYQRKIDVDGAKAPQAVQNALNEIQQGLDLYRNITRDLKRSMRINLPEGGIRKPQANFNPLQEMRKGMRYMGYMAIAFRLTPEDEKENFFNGELFTDISKGDIRFSVIKKLRFFQKIYFIRLFEKQATLIMSELVREELNRLNSSVVNGLSDKPPYYDLFRSFLGMKTCLPSIKF
jgi:LysM repeat protein